MGVDLYRIVGGDGEAGLKRADGKRADAAGQIKNVQRVVPGQAVAAKREERRHGLKVGRRCAINQQGSTRCNRACVNSEIKWVYASAEPQGEA